MRDTTTGELIEFAPNYDNNMALISRGYPSKPGAEDMLISLFNELVEKCPNYKSYVPKVTKEMVWDVIARLNMKVKSQVIVNLVTGRYRLIEI